MYTETYRNPINTKNEIDNRKKDSYNSSVMYLCYLSHDLINILGSQEDFHQMKTL